MSMRGIFCDHEEEICQRVADLGAGESASEWHILWPGGWNLPVSGITCGQEAEICQGVAYSRARKVKSASAWKILTQRVPVRGQNLPRTGRLDFLGIPASCYLLVLEMLFLVFLVCVD